MTRNERRTAVILDDHPLWLSALESILEEASVTVVGKTSTVNEALTLLDETKADLFVSDLRLSEGASGAACVREALRRHPDVRAVVVSGYDDPSSVEEALSSGAAGKDRRSSGCSSTSTTATRSRAGTPRSTRGQ